ncbi:DUF2793 domain-containing protein [Litoreibacter janthinus]|uniref:Uncharacterized protein n=1 Tax=Litoreibacter janthinus TaxID=670154 RepID=A0A1I6HB20_9RHOB|nr:DUF2793 domain-containing protein [Litoreibacter janthinus]SFR51551.1 Protein of unknown function [Litoreibacter janthinus]
MAETTTLKLPLLAASQAQKHVTVNEALARIDAALQLSVLSRSLATPPALAEEGDCYLVPAGGVNAWDNEDGNLAFFLNGGWEFLTPLVGWRLYVADEAVRVSFDGIEWQDNVLSSSPFGASMRAETVEFDFDIGAGANALTGFVIPNGSVVLAITGLVVAPITGTLNDWSLGVDVSDTRYGSGLGIGAGSWLRGITGQPQAYFSNTQLKLTANGGDFAGGTVRLAVHLLRFDLPRA